MSYNWNTSSPGKILDSPSDATRFLNNARPFSSVLLNAISSSLQNDFVLTRNMQHLTHTSDAMGHKGGQKASQKLGQIPTAAFLLLEVKYRIINKITSPCATHIAG